jgi:hypothetical protein
MVCVGPVGHCKPPQKVRGLEGSAATCGSAGRLERFKVSTIQRFDVSTTQPSNGSDLRASELSDDSLGREF